jgi:hypothetical protein
MQLGYPESLGVNMSLSFSSWSFDQPSYVAGSGTPISLTVNYSSTDLGDGSDVLNAVTVALSDAAGTASQTSDGSGSFPDLTTVTPGDTPQVTSVSATDNRPGTWTLVSNVFTGTVSPFAGVAVLSSVA